MTFALCTLWVMTVSSDGFKSKHLSLSGLLSDVSLSRLLIFSLNPPHTVNREEHLSFSWQAKPRNSPFIVCLCSKINYMIIVENLMICGNFHS